MIWNNIPSLALHKILPNHYSNNSFFVRRIFNPTYKKNQNLMIYSSLFQEKQRSIFQKTVFFFSFFFSIWSSFTSSFANIMNWKIHSVWSELFSSAEWWIYQMPESNKKRKYNGNHPFFEAWIGGVYSLFSCLRMELIFQPPYFDENSKTTFMKAVTEAETLITIEISFSVRSTYPYHLWQCNRIHTWSGIQVW